MIPISENAFRHKSSLKKDKIMQKPNTRNGSGLRFAILISLALLISSLLFFDYSTFLYNPNNIFTFLLTNQENTFTIWGDKTSLSNKIPDSDPCTGRYIYIQELPSRFNYDFIENCDALIDGSDRQPNMCPFLKNYGFGLKVENSKAAMSNSSWYCTHQFTLEVIFHNRMKSYKCLTNDSSMASAIFVPFYAGLDISRFMFGNLNETEKDSLGKDLAEWLSRKSEWKKMWGRDHFLVSGRIGWSYRRKIDNMSQWGSNFRLLPESKNMSMLAVEATSWKNDYAIPYPTPFHPSKDNEILLWQRRIRRHRRPYLFTFTGAPRPQLDDSLRGKIISHCLGSRLCKFLDCSQEDNCYNPIKFMNVFQSSVFCLQPPGDSHTRKSIFDSILAGCIPVFFDPASAYRQYLWHLPENGTKYSVYMPVRHVEQWNPDVENILLGFSKEEVVAMRREVIKMIPRIIYADPSSKFEMFEDAFDIAVKGMLERIEKVREVIRNGSDPSVGFGEEDLDKFTF